MHGHWWAGLGLPRFFVVFLVPSVFDSAISETFRTNVIPFGNCHCIAMPFFVSFPLPPFTLTAGSPSVWFEVVSTPTHPRIPHWEGTGSPPTLAVWMMRWVTSGYCQVLFFFSFLFFFWFMGNGNVVDGFLIPYYPLLVHFISNWALIMSSRCSRLRTVWNFLLVFLVWLVGWFLLLCFFFSGAWVVYACMSVCGWVLGCWDVCGCGGWMVGGFLLLRFFGGFFFLGECVIVVYFSYYSFLPLTHSLTHSLACSGKYFLRFGEMSGDFPIVLCIYMLVVLCLYVGMYIYIIDHSFNPRPVIQISKMMLVSGKHEMRSPSYHSPSFPILVRISRTGGFLW